MMKTKIIWVTQRFGLEELDKEGNLAFLCVIEMGSWGVEMEFGSRFVWFASWACHRIYQDNHSEKQEGPG